MKWVNALCSFLDLTTNNFGNQLRSQLRKRAVRGLALDYFNHLLANGPNLGGCGICSLFDLVRSSLGERDGEQAKEVIIGGFDDDVGFNERLPFADQ